MPICTKGKNGCKIDGCKQEKPEEEFRLIKYKYKGSILAYRDILCIKCRKQYAKEKRAIIHERKKQNRTRQSEKRFAAVLEEQNYSCGLCKVTFREFQFADDKAKKASKDIIGVTIIGLLCNRCLKIVKFLRELGCKDVIAYLQLNTSIYERMQYEEENDSNT